MSFALPSLGAECSTVLFHSILILHGNIVDTNDHAKRFPIDEISLIGLNLVEVLGVASHRLEGLKAVNPKLCSTIVFENGRCALDSTEITKVRCRVVLYDAKVLEGLSKNEFHHYSGPVPTCEYFTTPSRRWKGVAIAE
jgi:hypothetical protein